MDAAQEILADKTGARRRVDIANGDFLRIAAWGPPPRYQSNLICRKSPFGQTIQGFAVHELTQW